jgi:hypothetical protein
VIVSHLSANVELLLQYPPLNKRLASKDNVSEGSAHEAEIVP